MSQLSIVSLAEALWRARRDGGLVDPASIRKPASNAEAYAVQDEIVRLAGQPVRGFKVGSTSVEAQKLLGTSEPGFCPVLAPYFHAAPARITLVADHMPALEGEFAFRLGHDLPSRDAPYEASEVRDAIDAVAGAIEVVGTRLKGGLAGKGRFLVTADSGANIALVVGDWVNDWHELDLKSHSAAMFVNGELKGHGTGSRALGDPVAVMLWLANQQSHRGRGLKKGEVVSTGTCTGLDPVRSGDAVSADFGTLGKVSINFD
ncbi:MAG: 2-keto-4-pentenoate hydratase [Gammaproteobacteria bacterium]|jgi:2-keto-4-pentenoate hydratase